MAQYVFLLTLLVGSFVSTFILMPKIISLVQFKGLMDAPNERSSHSTKIPSLGGIAFYIVLTFGLYCLSLRYGASVSMSIVPGILILFIIGLKDDLVVLSPLTKILAEILAIGVLLTNSNFHITALHGFMGVEEISPYVSIPLAGFLMLTIINAYNLIDGIDGLASIVGIIIFAVLGFLFFMLEIFYYVGICVVMIGTLGAFLRFNLSSKKKVFMGDTGSLLVGFVIGIVVVRLFSVDPSTLKQLPFQIENLPLIVLAILIVPLFDTSRVFTIRLMNKKRPFSPDRNHIHHLMIDHLKLSHGMASIIIGLVNVLFISIFIILGANLDNFFTFGILVVCVIGFTYLFYRINFTYKNLKRRLVIKFRIKNLLKRFTPKSKKK